MIWAYMGPRETPPPLPEFEWMSMPAEQRQISPFLRECNWMQGARGRHRHDALRVPPQPARARRVRREHLAPGTPAPHGGGPDAGRGDVRRALRRDRTGRPGRQRDDVLAHQSVHVPVPHAVPGAARRAGPGPHMGPAGQRQHDGLRDGMEPRAAHGERGRLAREDTPARRRVPPADLRGPRPLAGEGEPEQRLHAGPGAPAEARASAASRRSHCRTRR